MDALRAGKFKLVLSEPLLAELRDVLSRPRLVNKYHLEPRDTMELVALLEEKAIKLEPPGELHLCRDPRDDFALETALLGRAEYAVSRDDDLKRDTDLVKEMQERGVKVVSVRQFLNALEDQAACVNEE